MAGGVRDCVREVGGRRREGGWAEKNLRRREGWVRESGQKKHGK